MSGEMKKPVVTKAGHTEIESEESKRGFFSRRKKPKKPTSTSSSKAKTESKEAKTTTEAQKQNIAGKKSRKRAKKQRAHKKRSSNTLQFNKRLVFISITGLALVILGYGIATNSKHDSTGFTSSDQSESGLLGDQAQALGICRKPEFKVLLMKDIPCEQQQYDVEIGAFFFQDMFQGVVITTNQLQLPPELALTPNAIKNLALSKEGVSSIAQLETNKGPIYLGNLESGGQVAIFDFDNLLLFIESTSVVSPEAWVEYINTLNY